MDLKPIPTHSTLPDLPSADIADHTGFLDLGGTRPMTGNLDMGAKDIVNINDLFLNSGGVINFNSGDVTLTHSANTLAMAGGDLELEAIDGAFSWKGDDIVLNMSSGRKRFSIASAGVDAFRITSTPALIEWLNINTNDAGNGSITFGNAVFDPTFQFLGNGTFTKAGTGATALGGTLDCKSLGVDGDLVVSGTNGSVAAVTALIGGTLSLATGSITDSGGLIDFVDENLRTSGQYQFTAAKYISLAAGAAGAFKFTNTGNNVAMSLENSDGSLQVFSKRNGETWIGAIRGAGADFYYFDNAADAETPMVRIYGFPTGESKKFGQFQIVESGGDVYFQISTDAAGYVFSPLIDISANTNLAVDTDHLKLTDDTLSFSDNEKTVSHSRQGSFLEQIDFTVSEAGGTVTGSLEKEGGGDLTQFWSDDFDVLDCTGPVCTVNLTAFVGTDTSPAAVFVYILQSAKTTLVANTSFPANTVEHIRVCSLVLQSAVTTGTEGALMVRNWNDPAFGITNPRGGDIVSSERVRKEHALHDSGVVLSITGSGTGTITLDTTAGTVYQFNLQSFPAIDMAGADNIHLVNLSGSEYSTTSNLVAGITTLADGATALGNNKYFNIVIWGVQNRTGETSHLMCNLPTGQYNSSLGGTTDSSKFSVHTIPSSFRGTGFLIAELTFQLTGGGSTWTLVQNTDLLGQTPTLVPGGGTTTAISIFSDASFELFDNGDDSKEGTFQLSGITAGNNRVLTWPDVSTKIWADNGSVPLTADWNVGNFVVTLGDGSKLATSAAPIADADIANKKYVDDEVGGVATNPSFETDDIGYWSLVSADIIAQNIYPEPTDSYDTYFAGDFNLFTIFAQYWRTRTNNFAFAAVHLPHGVTITDAIVYGNGATGQSWSLIRCEIDDNSTQLSLASAVYRTGVSSIGSVVDNSQFQYILSLELSSVGGQTNEVYGGYVKFTYP